MHGPQAKGVPHSPAAAEDSVADPGSGDGGEGAEDHDGMIGDPGAAHHGEPQQQPEAANDGDAEEDTGVCKFVHAWVMVLPGKRDITEAMFIEPSTGRKYPLNDSPYKGVEMLWNHRNFWVCMQQPQPHSDSRADPK